VTEIELQEWLTDCPTLYHMAAVGSWPSISRRGLLSTSTLLDLYEVSGRDRAEIEEFRRPTSVELVQANLPVAIIRDQIPMDDGGLRRCLPARMSPREWYLLLNSKVFFWLTKDRLLRLLNAGAYRNVSHDVIELHSRRLVEAYYDRIWLCPINSGCTKPFPHPRNEETFRRIPEYPYEQWRRRRKRGERVVELAVDDGVQNIDDFVLRVVEMRGDEIIRTIHQP
jgi:Family of unknown function (DUF7002)